MAPELSIPTYNEKDFCHFCFGATNLVVVFPHVRPDLLSFIDNVIGIPITTEAQETFSLCGECIATMDQFTTFRSKCRSHYDKVREVKIMNEAVKKMFPLMQQKNGTNPASPTRTPGAVNRHNASITNGEVMESDISLVEVTSTQTSRATPTAPPSDTTAPLNDSTASVSKRIHHQSSPLPGADSSIKKARTQNESNRKTKYHHIRELMQRFRDSRLMNNDAAHRPSVSPVETLPRSIDFTNNLPPLNSNSTIPTHIPQCKPCVVVVEKFTAHRADSRVV